MSFLAVTLGHQWDEENVRRMEAEKELEAASEALLRSTQQLQQEKSYMDEIFFSMREPLLVVDHNGTIQECNTALLKMAGRTRVAVIGQPVDQLVEAVDGKQQNALLQSIVSLYQKRLQTHHDMNHELFQQLLGELPTPLLVVDLKEYSSNHAEIYLVSKALEQWLERPADGLLGENLFQLLPESEHPQLRKQIEQACEQSVSFNAAPYHWLDNSSESQASDLCIVHIHCCGGERLLIQLHVERGSNEQLLLTMPVEGKLTQLFPEQGSEFVHRVGEGIRRDVEQVKGDGSALISYLQASPFSMVLLNSTQQVVRANATLEQLTGCSEATLKKEGFEKLIPEPVQCSYQKMVEALSEAEQQIPLLLEDGSEQLIEMLLLPVVVEGERHTLIVMHDPKERESVEIFYAIHSEEDKRMSSAERMDGDWLLRSGEESVPIAVSGSLLHNVDGGVNGVVLMLHDLTTRKRAEQREQYAAYQSGIAEMTAQILHNVGNTVQGMDSALLGLGRQLKGVGTVRQLYEQLNENLEVSADAQQGADADEAKEKIIEAGRRLPKVLKEMEALWKPSFEVVQTGVNHVKEVIRAQQKGKGGDVYLVWFSVEQLLDDLYLINEPQLKNKKITLKREVDPTIADVYMPRNQLLQALINLMVNSVEAIQQRVEAGGLKPGAGEITIAVRVVEEQLLLTVSDNGNGFDASVSDRLLQFGFTTKPNGSGIGLHSVANFVISCNGKIDVESHGVGRGGHGDALPAEGG